jgi:GntR family transcriptional regulator
MKYDTQTVSQPFAFRLDAHSGVPVYRQLIDQVQGAIAMGVLRPGDQLPTVRLVAVELAINPNTVMRAYRELEIRGVLDTQQGTGTFVSDRPAATTGETGDEKARKLTQLVGEFVARAGAAGLSLDELMEALRQHGTKPSPDAASGQSRRTS